jgi:hypothetical protein
MFDTLEVNETKKEVGGVVTFNDQYATFMTAVDDHIVALKKDPNLDLADMDTRFSTAVRLQWLQNKTVVLIGVGGIGNWVWQALVSMGVEKIILIDNDDVEIHNIGPQAHHLIHLGMSKVDAAKNIIKLYRGVSVRTLKNKVQNLAHLVELIGEVPDILITAVDNMEFRNQLAEDFRNIIRNAPNARNAASLVPEFLIDLRMSLGDWTAYALPLRSILAHPRANDLYAHYTSTAVFKTEQAVQEPCTARAISYTGMNIASYVGAILHWYANEGRPYLAGTLDGYAQDPIGNLGNFVYALDGEKIQFYMHKTWSSRDWEGITPSYAERMFKKRVLALTSEIDGYEQQVAELKSQNQNLIDMNNALKDDLVAANAGKSTKATAPKNAAPKAKVKEEVPAPAPAQERVSVLIHDLDPGRRFEVDGYQYEAVEAHPTYVTAYNLGTNEVERIGLRILNEALYMVGYEPGGSAMLEDPQRLLPEQAPMPVERVEEQPRPAPRLRRRGNGGVLGGATDSLLQDIFGDSVRVATTDDDDDTTNDRD